MVWKFIVIVVSSLVTILLFGRKLVDWSVNHHHFWPGGRRAAAATFRPLKLAAGLATESRYRYAAFRSRAGPIHELMNHDSIHNSIISTL